MSNNKSNRKASTLLALIAVISVLVIFVATCFLILLFLYKLGVYELPQMLSNKKEISTEQEYQLEELVDYEIKYDEYSFNDNVYYNLLVSVPIQRNYFIQANVTSFDKEETNYTYWVWRYGDKYRIAILDVRTNEAIKIITCDGVNVKIQNQKEGTVEFHKVSNGYAFVDQVPNLDFSYLQESNEKGYILSSLNTEQGIQYTIEHVETGETIELLLDSNIFFPRKYTIKKGEQEMFDYNLILFEEVDFYSDDQFKID